MSTTTTYNTFDESPVRYPRSLRVVWITLLLVCVGLFWSAVFARYAQLTVPGEGTYQLHPIEIAYLADRQISPNAYAAYIVVLEILQMGIFVILSVFLFLRRSQDYATLFSAFTLLLIGIAAPATIKTFDPDTIGGQITYLLELCRYAVVLLFVYSFPDGRFYPHWTRITAAIGVVIIIALPIVGLDTRTWSSDAITIGVLAWLIPPIAAQWYRYRVLYNQDQRQQTKWFLLGFTVLVFASLIRGILTIAIPALGQPGEIRLLFHTLFAIPVVDTVLFALWPISIAASILQYRLYNVDLVVNRSLVYGGLTLTLLILFFAGFFAINLLLRLIGLQDETLALVIATAISVGLFNPARLRLQHLVDRRFFNLRLDLNELQKRAQASAKAHADSQRIGIQTGKQVDDYQIGDLIGKGGMGEVYKAQHLRLNRPVAIKTVSGSGSLERFEREAQIVAALQHPHIVEVFDYGVVDGQPYMVMEYLEGTTLAECLEHGKLPLQQVQQILLEVASALDYAHERGLVHRDIKPSNIMLQKQPDGTERAILMDFGIVKLNTLDGSGNALTRTGAIGTLEYSAPEQIMNSKTVDHRADLYALGVTAYQMLTGKPPFHGSLGEVVFAHLQQPPPDPSEVVSEIPPNIAYAVMRAMAKDPADRFASAGEFAKLFAFT
ncbi:MAG: serine/threonine protein kinase [Anaerolineae bacterium]|jgi:hypothetical protein|nr:serine/threonine protein kinase [Anaerolineae bacterium]